MNITLFTIGKTRVRLNALFLLPMFLAFLTGNGSAFLLTIVALSLHEAAHAAMTFACGAQIAQIDIHPLGLSATPGRGVLGTGDELAVAAAGPIFSLTAGIAASLIYKSEMLQSDSLLLFAHINILLAFINLLPAPPLDGSAMLRTLVSCRCTEKTTHVILAVSGFITAALLSCAGIRQFIRGASFWLAAFASLFLFISAANELKNNRGGRAGAVLRRNSILRASRSVRVREIALCGCTTAEEALRLTVTGLYTRYLVIGDDCREIGTLNENDLYEGIARYGSNVKLKSLLRSPIDQKATW